MSRMFGEDAIEMGTRIVLFALTPRVRPSENRDYYDLIQAYKSQPEVREAAKLIAHAMRVQLCDDAFFLDSTGPIAILSPGSLFIPKLADFRGGMKVNERLGYGLLFFVVAAYVFPSADALAEDTVALGHKITDTDLTRFAIDIVGVQYICGTGINDIEALGAFPKVIRLRNSSVSRSGAYVVKLDQETFIPVSSVAVGARTPILATAKTKEGA